MLVLPKDIEKQLKHEFLTTHGKMASTTPILPENYDYPLPDFVHRLVHGIGIDERIEKARKEAEEKAEKVRKEAEEKMRKVEATQVSAVKKLRAMGFALEQISDVLDIPIEKIRSFLF